MRPASAGGSPNARSCATASTAQQSEQRATCSSAARRSRVLASGSSGWPGTEPSRMAMTSSWFTAALWGTEVGGPLCRPRSLGVLKCLAECPSDAFQLTGDTVAGEALAGGDLLFGQVFHELEPCHFEP